MPRHCVVPGCKSNYYSKDDIKSTFSFPKNIEMQQKWINAIQRVDWTPTNFSSVCAIHFQESDFQPRLHRKIPRLVDGAIPSIFNKLSDHLTGTETMIGNRKEKICGYADAIESKSEKLIHCQKKSDVIKNFEIFKYNLNKTLNISDKLQMEKLIELIRENPHIYDKSNAGYKNDFLRKQTWKNISITMKSDETDCKAKWKALKDAFYKEKQKEQKPTRNGVEIKSKWKYIKNLNFLELIPKAITNFEYVETDLETQNESTCSEIIQESKDIFDIYEEIVSTPTSPATSIQVNSDCSTINANVKHIFKEIIPHNTEEEHSFTPFFKNAAELVKNANLSTIELIELQIEILSTIKRKIENKK